MRLGNALVVCDLYVFFSVFWPLFSLKGWGVPKLFWLKKFPFHVLWDNKSLEEDVIFKACDSILCGLRQFEASFVWKINICWSKNCSVQNHLIHYLPRNLPKLNRLTLDMSLLVKIVSVPTWRNGKRNKNVTSNNFIGIL